MSSVVSSASNEDDIILGEANYNGIARKFPGLLTDCERLRRTSDAVGKVFRNPYFRIDLLKDEQNSNSYGAIALRDLPAYQPILIEPAFLQQPNHQGSSGFQREVNGSQALQSLQKQLIDYAREGNTGSTASAEGIAKVTAIMDEMVELYMQWCCKNKKEIFTPITLRKMWTLADRKHCPTKGSIVCLTGLTSEAGKALNGRLGQVVGKANDEGRFPVRLSDTKASAPCSDNFSDFLKKKKKYKKILLKPDNLKTLGGILSTNSFPYSFYAPQANGHIFPKTWDMLFEVISHLEVATGSGGKVPNVFQKYRKDEVSGKLCAVLFTKRKVSKGERLYIQH
eukprot:g2987.t1